MFFKKTNFFLQAKTVYKLESSLYTIEIATHTKKAFKRRKTVKSIQSKKYNIIV